MKSGKKKNKLSRRLDQLPKHTPPPTTWERLEHELKLEKQLGELPAHTPPDSVWVGIEQGLSNQSDWKIYIAIAASILLIGSGLFWYKQQSIQTYEERNYSQEIAPINPINIIETEWDTSQQTEEQIRIYCQVKLLACSSPAFRRLEKKLQALEDAKMELQAAMQIAGKTPDLMSQMTEIEQERSAILQEMIVHVL